MKVGYAPRALRDLETIAAYLRERSPSGTRKVLAAIKAAVDVIVFLPEITPVLDEAGHRRLPIHGYPYAIFYQVKDEELLILHIRHTSRRPIDPAEL
jgi:plasmid stabilization system protein ParE